jgi:3-deoxy-D-manno-octulosonic-acid transferase
MKLLYNISLHLYLFAIRIASLFNAKAKQWIDGRKNLFSKLRSEIQGSTSNIQNPASDIIWFHCASLGEFEQGRPLIEKIKAENPEIKILLTFFSPSGYEIRKNYSGADLIFYLPLDTSENAKQFIEIVKPKAVFFVKYEFWFNYLNELKDRKIATYLVSGIFREDHYFFKSYGSWFREQLNCFTHFYLQNEQSEKLLNTVGFTNTSVVGDTRFDRVFEIAKSVKSFPIIEQFKQNKKVLILGSSWPEDEEIIAEWCKQKDLKALNYKLIIAPHEIDASHIESILDRFSGFKIIRYSLANSIDIDSADILIIDNIGMLSSLYQYGTIAFIGGGFGKGIHNILEAATFGLPVIFGPNYEKFTEAKELIKSGGAFSINSLVGFGNIFDLLSDKEVLNTASHISKYYVQSRIGATDKILRDIKILLRLN